MIFFYISLSTYLCFLILKFNKGIMLLNSCKNNLKIYLKKLKKNFKELFLTPELFGIVLIVIMIMTNAKISGICFVIFYTLMSLYLLKKTKGKINFKNNINLIIIMSFLFILINVLIYLNYLSLESSFIVFDITWIYYVILIVFSYLAYLVILFSKLINRPIELILEKKHKL